jgi:uncharacterized protein YfaT (DUF1175 family)
MPTDVSKTISGRYEPNDAESYDEWFVRQVKEGLREADDPNTVWVSNEEVFRKIDERLKIYRERAALKQAS